MTITWNVQTQSSYNGKHFLIQTVASDKEICSNHLSHHVVIYFHKLVTSGIRHSFIVHDLSTNASKQFYFDAYYTSGMALYPTTITINDMKITGQGECWFCGKKTVDMGGTYYPGIGWIPETDEYGIVGHFNIYSVMSGNGSYELFTIQGTGGLTRIEPRGSYEQIFMVGYPFNCPLDANGSPTASCLVGLGYNPNTDIWTYDIVHPTNTNEIFTDVVDASVGIVVVSRFKDDHYHIGLRHTKNGPISGDDYLSLLSNSNIYDMQLANSYTTNNPVAWRNDADPILLASDDCGMSVTMTHPCDNIAYGIASFKLSVPNMGDVHIDAAKYIPNTSYLSLLDSKANCSNPSTCYLVDDNNQNQYSVYIINWISSYPFYIYIKANCSKNDYCWQSLVTYDSSTYSFRYIVGHNPNNSLTYTKYKSLPPTPFSSTCIGKSSYSIQNLTIPTPTTGDNVYFDPAYNAHQTVPMIGNFTSMTVVKNTLCTF